MGLQRCEVALPDVVAFAFDLNCATAAFVMGAVIHPGTALPVPF